MKSYTVLLGLLLILSCPQVSKASPRELGWVSVELDPITTVMGARNLLVNITAPSLAHWSITGIAFAADFPGWVDNILSYRNRNKDFKSKINLSPGASVDYYFSDDRSGWHTGLLMFLWRYEVTRNADRSRFLNHIVMPRVGYRWFPLAAANFYLAPFAGMMFEYNLDGNNHVDGSTVATPHRPLCYRPCWISFLTILLAAPCYRAVRPQVFTLWTFGHRLTARSILHS